MANLHAPGWAASGIRSGMSATAALRDFRSAGGKISDGTWFRLYAEQKASISNIINEATAPLASIPRADEMTVVSTKRNSGYLQTVDVYMRLTGTNVVRTQTYMIKGSDVMSRGEAVQHALTKMQEAADDGRYDETVLGGVYTGTHIMTPGMAA